MLIIPAIDLRGGSCVRLVHGDPAKETVYSSDPVEMARRWVADGAKRLHLVDLDAALGSGSNLETVYRIKKAVGCEVEFGGGLRSLDFLKQVMDKGVDRAIIGTALFSDSAWVAEGMKLFGARLMAGVDARDGEVKLKGWKAGSGIKLPEALAAVKSMGFREIIFTDISKDGTLTGPNIEATRSVMKMTGLAVYASGGMSSLKDISALKVLEKEGLAGCILGKALYDGRMTLKDALAAAK